MFETHPIGVSLDDYVGDWTITMEGRGYGYGVSCHIYEATKLECTDSEGFGTYTFTIDGKTITLDQLPDQQMNGVFVGVGTITWYSGDSSDVFSKSFLFV